MRPPRCTRGTQARHPAAISFATPSTSRITHRRHRPFRAVTVTQRTFHETSLQKHRPRIPTTRRGPCDPADNLHHIAVPVGTHRDASAMPHTRHPGLPSWPRAPTTRAIPVAHHIPSASTIAHRYRDPADVSRNVPTRTSARSIHMPRRWSRRSYPPHTHIPAGCANCHAIRTQHIAPHL